MCLQIKSIIPHFKCFESRFFPSSAFKESQEPVGVPQAAVHLKMKSLSTDAYFKCFCPTDVYSAHIISLHSPKPSSTTISFYLFLI